MIYVTKRTRSKMIRRDKKGQVCGETGGNRQKPVENGSKWTRSGMSHLAIDGHFL